MTESKGQAFVRALDTEALLDNALRNIGAAEQSKRNFRTGFKSGYVRSLAKGLEPTSDYKLLRLRQTNEQWRAMFRLLNQDGGLNYHDLILVRGNDASVRIADFYVALSGELMSTTIRRLALPILSQTERSLLDRLVGTESELIKHQKDWSRMVLLSQQGKGEEALAVYQKLPATLQREKFLLIARLTAAQQVSDDEYQQTIAFWEKAHPSDPSLNLVSIDGFFMAHQYEKSIAVIDRLDKAIGGDPYLDVLRASQYRLLKQRDNARRYATQALRAEPNLAAAYDCLLGLALDEKDFKETVRLLTEAEKHLKADILEVVNDDDNYEEFRKSSNYRDWVKLRDPK